MAEVYHNNIIDIDLESGTLFRSFLNHTIGSGDNNANWYGVRVFRKGEPIALSGCSVQGLFMPASGSAILISDGTHTWVSGNEAAVLLPQACYNVKGRFTLAIKIIGTNSYPITDTVRIVDGIVADTNSESPVAPTAAVPTYQEILAVYEQMVTVKEGSVLFNSSQSLTDGQKAQARDNISAASAEEVSDLNSGMDSTWEYARETKNLFLLNNPTNLFPHIESNEFVSGYLENGSVVSNSGMSYVNIYVPVEGNTQYTIGLIPQFGSATTPWAYSTHAGEFYDADKHFINNMDSSSGTFVTPMNARYLRVNVYSGVGVTLERMNDRCMLVEGGTRPSTYTAYDGPKEYLSGEYIQDVIEGITDYANGAYDLIDERTLYDSANKYNPELQTENTISPHYWVNGAPYSSTQYDEYYHCTAPIPVKPNTQYTIRLVPAFTNNGSTLTEPWGSLDQSVFFYDSSNRYLGKRTEVSGGTFTTPVNTAYIRFNYLVSITLAGLNATTMMVYGSTAPTTYVDYVHETIKETVEGFLTDIEQAVETADNTQEILDLLLGDYTVTYSPNLYNPALQTPETISPHYYVNGVPYSTTQFDTSYNCTAPFEIEPNTQYSLGLVPPASNGTVKPWSDAGYGIFFYDENGTYISGTTNITFTTPANAKTMRFNYFISANIVSLNVLNASCMLVKGDTLPSTYQEYGDKLDSELQQKIDSIGGIGIEYKFSGSDVLVSYGYNSTHDAVVVMNAGRANGLFDFAKLCLKTKGRPLSDYETSGLTVVWSSGTDMHGPFQFLAVNNADGYHADATSAGFVGGNHTLDQLGSDFKTASSKYIQYFADGKPVTEGYGNCTTFEVRWANNVQAYNTVKQGGGGRACLTEYHDMIFDGVQFNETVRLVALEDIKMSLWYGFQFVSWGTQYTNLRFIEGGNRGVLTGGSVESGNLLTSGMEAWGSDHKIVLTVDNYFDLGKRENVASSYNTRGAFTSNSKGYFNIINTTGFTMGAGEAYYMRGSFRFCPAISAGD